jgi:dTDP-4-amino-4,6-dideoxygalactose transaminase
MTIPFFQSARQYKILKKEVRVALEKVLSSSWYVLGEEGKRFEDNFADFIGTKYAIGVNSCTDAIKIALRSLDIGPGDEVITVSNTAVPTISAIREIGAMPLFVDVDQYFTIDVTKIESKITKKTKAILPVHIYGGACDMKMIGKIAKKHKLKIIEDCAQATGTDYNGQKVGSFGDASCFSFYPTKNLGAFGDGGIILTSSKKTALKCRALRMYGMEQGYYSKFEGYNSRLDEIQAAILQTKLPHLNDWNKRRRQIAEMYITKIKNSKIILPQIRPGSNHAFHLFVIRTADRINLTKHLKNFGIGYGIHYSYPIHLQSGYQFLKKQSMNLKLTEKVANEILSLPIFPELKNSEVQYIINILNAYGN